MTSSRSSDKVRLLVPTRSHLARIVSSATTSFSSYARCAWYQSSNSCLVNAPAMSGWSNRAILRYRLLCSALFPRSLGSDRSRPSSGSVAFSSPAPSADRPSVRSSSSLSSNRPVSTPCAVCRPDHPIVTSSHARRTYGGIATVSRCDLMKPEKCFRLVPDPVLS